MSIGKFKSLTIMKYLLYIIATLLIVIWIVVFKPTGMVHLLLIAAAAVIIITMVLKGSTRKR
jgi:hypothetical protein